MRCLIASAGLAVCLCWLTASAAAQGDYPDCDPASMLAVTLKAHEQGREGVPPVATHEIEVEAEISGNASRVSMVPRTGVRTASSGEQIAMVAPNSSSVDITVTWRQSRDPSDPYGADDPSTGCVASRVIPVALASTLPTHAVKHELWRQLVRSGFSDVGILPARRRPDLSPLEVSARTTSRVAFPPASARQRTMAVPLRAADRLRYSKRLPNPAYMTVPQACRFYYLACATPFARGGAFVQVGMITERRRTINGPLLLLARSQPFKTSAPYGISVEARPGSVRLGRPRPFGYDVQVRQSGRLIARLRQAGRCTERRLPQGLFTSCKIARSSYELH